MTTDEKEKVLLEVNKAIVLLDNFPNDRYTESLTKELILLVGVSGSGKSTVAQFLSGNKNLTVATVIDEKRVFGTGIGRDDKTSFTLYPELLEVNSENTKEKKYVIADCGGFGDSRDASTDIAVTISTQKLLSKTKKVKIILVVTNSGIREPNGRTAFLDLLEHMNSFLKNASIFKENIGIIVNKFPHDKTIKGFITYLQANYGDNQLIINLLENGAQLIKPLRSADKHGLLHDSQMMMDDKAQIEELFYKNTKFADVENYTFGITLSEKSTNTLTKMYEQIYQELRNEIDNIKQKICSELTPKSTNISVNLNNFHEYANFTNTLDASLCPRSNMLETLQRHHFKDKDLKCLEKYEDFLEKMKRLPQNSRESNADKEVRDKVEIAKGSIVKKLNIIANSMFGSVRYQLQQQMNEVFKNFKSRNFEINQLTNKDLKKTLTNQFALRKQISDAKNNANATYLLDILQEGNTATAQECRKHDASLKNITDSGFVTNSTNVSFSVQISDALTEFDKHTIEKIGTKIFENCINIVNQQVGELGDSLKNEYAVEVEDVIEAEDRIKALEKYKSAIDGLQDEELLYEGFLTQLYLYYKNNNEPFPVDQKENLEDVENDVKFLKKQNNDKIKETASSKKRWGKSFKGLKTYLTNSGSTTPSFINSVVRWIKNKVNMLLLPTDNLRLLSNNALQTIGFESNIKSPQFFPAVDINSTILILDMIVRKFTKTKPQHHFEDSAHILEAQAHALNIVEECEATWTMQNDEQQEPFDFPGMQKQVLNQILQLDDIQNVKYIRKKALQIIDSYCKGSLHRLINSS